jgi:hypothetical protein
MASPWKLRTVRQVLKALGLICLLTLVLCQPTGDLETTADCDPRDPVLAVSQAPLGRPDSGPAPPEARGEQAPPEAHKPAREPGPGALPKLPRVVRFALPEGLNQAKLGAIVKKYAEEHGVDEDLVWAVMRQESGFNSRAVSPKGAMGLMQLMPGTAALMGVKDPFDVEQNIAGGIKYLETCLNRFDQDVSLALAAYNAGPGNVVKYQGCPPFQETRHYVAAVLAGYAAPPQYRGFRLRAEEFSSSLEDAEPSEPSGLQWNLPAPVVKVSKPQWRLRSPRWNDFSWPGRLQAMADSTDPTSNLDH